MLNELKLIGNVGKAPELRYTSNGTAVCNFSVATNKRWTDRDGNKQERTMWHRVVTWGKQAEFVGEHIKGGRLVYVQGELEQEEWTDRDGVRQTTIQCRAYKIIPLGKRDDAPTRDTRPRDEYPPRTTTTTAPAPAGPFSHGPGDDIPF